MTSINSTSTQSLAALHRAAAAKPAAPIKANDGDADDAPRAAAPAKLASTGPGQLIDKLA